MQSLCISTKEFEVNDVSTGRNRLQAQSPRRCGTSIASFATCALALSACGPMPNNQCAGSETMQASSALMIPRIALDFELPLKDFGDIQVGSVSTATVALRNSGESIAWLANARTSPPFEVLYASDRLNPNESTPVRVSVRISEPGQTLVGDHQIDGLDLWGCWRAQGSLQLRATTQ